MSFFIERIAQFAPSKSEARTRRWIYVPYDRLHDGVGPLAETRPEDVVLVFMESVAKGTRRPYHKKKLTLVLSAMRHFALEQAERGCRVVYGASPTSFAERLLALQEKWQWDELVCNRPAERELRVELEGARDGSLSTPTNKERPPGAPVRSREAGSLAALGMENEEKQKQKQEQKQGTGLRIRFVEDTAWLSTAEDFERAFPKRDAVKAGQRAYLMDTFYRAMRQKSGLLMERGKPVGGKFSYDAENRLPWKNELPVPVRPSFAPDAITQEVMALVEQRHPDTFGSLAGFDLAVTRSDAEAAWAFALDRCLPYFGPWEDAMSSTHPDLFHSMVSPQLNLTLLRPRDLVEQVAEAYAAGSVPLASAEGFIRQVLGWREFVRHIHEATDGFRKLSPTAGPMQGAEPNHLSANRRLPPVYWGTPSGMTCMDTVVAGVVVDGWSHHITRLMVLSNLATLCGFSPRELTDWFWFAYVDAYDWVVEPNVLGMSTFADGGLTATKPYVSGAAYINKMSDFCGRCRLNPKRAVGPGSCPFTALYWSFLERNEELLAPLNRMAMPLATMRKRSAAERSALRERAEAAIGQLERGEIVT